jgi:tetratricopeptide (TPR) repeat protein
VVKVFSKVQCNMRPTNPVEVQAGGVPRFAKLSFFAEDKTTFPVKPEAAMQIQLAGHSEAEGKIEEAIQHYRQALDMDPDNPGALNNLAWILATAGKPGLRDGERAMQLAAKAVELTDRRLPAFIRTLAAAYAEAGQFSDAIKVGVTALNLALITGQTEEAAENARLCRLYAAGKTADASSDP